MFHCASRTPAATPRQPVAIRHTPILKATKCRPVTQTHRESRQQMATTRKIPDGRHPPGDFKWSRHVDGWRAFPGSLALPTER